MSMTLEQVRDWHRAREASFANSKSKLFSKEDARAKRKHRQMADAIDARLAAGRIPMDLSDDCLAALVRLYKVTCVTALSEMVGMDGTPNDNQLDASIEAGVRAVAEAVGKGLALFAEAASKRTVADDLRDYGNAFEVDGRRIEPWRVAACPKPPRAVPDGWRETILSVLSALDVATGDSDPNIDPDMNDDEVREEYPEVWAMQQLSAMLAAAAPAIDAPDSKP